MLPELGATTASPRPPPRCRSPRTCCRSRPSCWCPARSASAGAGGGRSPSRYARLRAGLGGLRAGRRRCPLFLGGAGAAGRRERVHHPAAARRARDGRARRSGWGGRWAGSGRCRPPGQTSAPLDRRARRGGGLAAARSSGWPGRRGAARAGRDPCTTAAAVGARRGCASALRPAGAARRASSPRVGVGLSRRAELPGRAAAGGAVRASAPSGRGLVLTGLGVAGIADGPRWSAAGVDRIGPRRSVLLGRRARGARGRRAWVSRPTSGWSPLLWAVGGVGHPARARRGQRAGAALGGGEPGRIDVGGARRSGSAVARRSPVVVTPIYHADPLAGFLIPAALLAVVVPVALPRAGRSPYPADARPAGTLSASSTVSSPSPRSSGRGQAPRTASRARA